jgi:hypothetical protein
MYHIVVYQNKKRKRFIKSFKTYNEANTFFLKFLSVNKVIFPKYRLNTENDLVHELAILSDKSSETNPLQYEEGLTIKKKVEIDIEETVYNTKSKQRYTILEIIKKFVKGKSNLNFYPIHNKLVIQDSMTDLLEIFVFKDVDDCNRFFRLFKLIIMKNFEYSSYLFFDNVTKDIQSNIIDKVITQYNVQRHYMLRQVTKNY